MRGVSGSSPESPRVTQKTGLAAQSQVRYSKHKIMGPIVKKHKWAILYLVLIFSAAVFVIYRSFYQPDNPDYIEIMNYSGSPEIYKVSERKWRPLERGEMVGVLDEIRTAEKSDVDFKIANVGIFRLKENSLLRGRKSELFDFDKPEEQGIHLDRGKLLGFVTNDSQEAQFKVATPLIQAVAQPGTLFLLATDEKEGDNNAWAGVLRGQLTVTSKLLLKKQALEIQSLQQTRGLRGKPLSEPDRISRDEWDEMKEGYELTERMAPTAQNQLDLSQEAGSLFAYVYDHGTFYTPKLGYSIREFVEDPNSGEVTMTVDYDVFPTGSFVGIYILTRQFDSKKHGTLEFEMKRDADAGYPEMFRIELKGKSGLIRAYTVNQVKEQWRQVSFPLPDKGETNIAEITFVFANNQVGEHKKGIVHFRNIHLTPRETPVEEEPAQKKVEATPPVLNESSFPIESSDSEDSAAALREAIPQPDEELKPVETAVPNQSTLIGN